MRIVKNVIENYIFTEKVRKGMCLQNFWKPLAGQILETAKLKYATTTS